MPKYRYQHGNDEIVVKTPLLGGSSELYINGEMTDRSFGLFEDRLHGKLKSGEEIKAICSVGFFTPKVTLFVDGKLSHPLK
ncbi:MAG: hypothetical protein FWB93_05055 [Oscillospiraceae bacterium]|nr:hypothetical protein [Oscillospiraceae bacterium]